jgi:hypothetical protein
LLPLLPLLHVVVLCIDVVSEVGGSRWVWARCRLPRLLFRWRLRLFLGEDADHDAGDAGDDAYHDAGENEDAGDDHDADESDAGDDDHDDHHTAAAR